MAQTVPVAGLHGGGVKDGKNGKNGGATGVTELDAAEDKESTTPLFNLTVKVYAVPLVSPVTVIGEVDEVPVIASGFDVAI